MSVKRIDAPLGIAEDVRFTISIHIADPGVRAVPGDADLSPEYPQWLDFLKHRIRVRARISRQEKRVGIGLGCLLAVDDIQNPVTIPIDDVDPRAMKMPPANRLECPVFSKPQHALFVTVPQKEREAVFAPGPSDHIRQTVAVESTKAASDRQ